MTEMSIFFVTSYSKYMLKTYKIFINDREQSTFYSIEKEDKKIFVNEILLNGKNEIIIKIEYQNKLNKYKMKLDIKKGKKIYFLLNYELESIQNDIKEIIKRTYFYYNEEIYINENFSLLDKFSFIYEYLLKKKSDIFKEENHIYYLELIETFIKEKKENTHWYSYGDNTLPIDIVISILINYFKKFWGFNKIIINWKSFSYNYNNYININNYNEIYLEGIKKCLNELINLNSDDKNIKNRILEIIMIYFIKYRNKDLNLILSNNYKNMFISIFLNKQLNYLNKDILDDTITDKIIQSIDEIKVIESIIKGISTDYVSYFTKIDNNFEKIFKVMKNLKGIFKIDFKVSQADDIKRFAKLHNGLLEKQEIRGKFFLSFIKIIEQYFTLYDKNEDLTNCCELINMILFEERLFPKIVQIKTLKEKISTKIRDLLEKKIKNGNIRSDEVIQVLVKLKKIFNDENIFNCKYKENISKYFVQKCLNNDLDLKNFMDNKISELFNLKNEANSIIQILGEEKEKLDMNSKWIYLLPDEYNDKDLKIISILLNKILEKYDKKDLEDYQIDKNIIFNIIFKKKNLNSILDKIEINENNNYQFINIIIVFLKAEKELEKNILKYLDDNFLKKNKFYMEHNHKDELIPIFILQKIELISNLKKNFINQLSNYVIDDKALLQGDENNKFLLLREMYKKNYFDYDYKKKTNKFISDLNENKKNYSLDDFKKIYENILKLSNNQIFSEKQCSELKKFKLNVIAELENDIQKLNNILKFLKKLESNDSNINNIENLVERLEGKIKYYLDNYYQKDETEIKNFINQYEYINRFLPYLDSQIFLNIIFSKEINNNVNKNDIYEEAKSKIDELIKVLFDKNSPGLNDIIESHSLLFEKISNQNELRKQIAILYYIYTKGQTNVLPEEYKYNKIKFFVALNMKYKIIKGIYNILESIEITKTNFYNNLKEIYDYCNSERDKEKYDYKNKTIDDFFEANELKNKIIIQRQEDDIIIKPEKKDCYNLFETLSEYPDAIIWLINQKEKDIQLLCYFINDSDFNQYIDSLRLTEIKEYFVNLKNKNDSDIIKNLINIMDKDSDEKKNLLYYIEVFPILKKYKLKKEGKPMDLYAILNKLDKAKFYLKYNRENQIYELNRIEYDNKDIMEEYKELSEKSFFIISHTKENVKINNELTKKTEINNYIKEYLSILNNRKNLCQQDKKIIKLEIRNNDIYELNKTTPLKDLIKTIKEESNEKILYDYYDRDEYLRIFTGIQLNIMMKLLKERNYSELRYLFSPFINNIVESHLSLFFPYYSNNIFEPTEKIRFSSQESYENKLKKISKYLKNIIGDNINDIFEKSIIKTEYINIYKSNYIYIKSFFNDEFEEYILDIFFYFTGNLPSLSNIFIFDEETLEQEYVSFLYKIKKTDLNCLFVLIIKSCKNENEINLFKKIKEVIINKNRKTIFLILYSDQLKEDKMKNYINNVKPFEFDEISNWKKEIKQILKKRVEIIYSNLSGAGKTTYIHNLAKKSKYIYFPIKAHYGKNNLINQLKEEIKIDKDRNNIIHIDLYDSLKENVVKEFLFYFIFFKFYGKDNLIFNYGYYEKNEDKIKIIIELPNTYKNYFDKYKILNYINAIEINSKMLKENGYIDSNIQISNMLKLFYEDKLKNLDFTKKKDFNDIINYTLNRINENKIKEYEYNFYQKNNFIKILSTEFNIFINCINLNPEIVFDNSVPKFFSKLRYNIISSQINNSKYIIELGDLEYLLYVINEEKRKNNFEEIVEIVNIIQNEKIENYNQLTQSLVGMHSNGMFLTIISSKDNSEIILQINEYIKSINEQISKVKLKNLQNPNKLEDSELFDELLKLIIVEEDLVYKEYKIKKAIKSTFDDYIFTFDNFLKMALIFLRIRAGIPTILMGETGCGKTYLIKMLSLIYGQSPKSMYIKKFHAGITDNDIINFIKTTINNVKTDEDEIIKNMDLYMEKNNHINTFEINYNNLWFFQKWFADSAEKNYEKYKNKFKEKIRNRKVIIFLDEINTSYELGTIKRIICDNNFRKKYNIPERFIIICACNPYRLLNEKNQNLQFGLSLRYKKNKKLVYTVNPLPYSLFNFILYFNDISKETTKKYIQKMTQKISCEISDEHKQLIIGLIAESHFFVRVKGDISSVSLREINRFKKFYCFFFKKYFNEYRRLNLSKKDLEINSLILSLYFCYYLRFPTNGLREEYVEKIISDKIKNFKKFCEDESKFITIQVLQNKIGYSKNKALCENIFSELICILLREPLIICGKPGSSKTLSMRLLLDTMKGPNSYIEFFKQFPEVITSFYQCSLTSTSENLEELFKKAEERLKKTNYEKISLIFIDEMGIADESENNPLKVLHSKLDENNDIQDLKQKLAMIGISNWTLDAAKINRTIYSVVPAPDIKYISETEKEIARAIDINIKIRFPLGEIYLEYIKKQGEINKEDFHGFRDFYYCVKYICYNIKNINDNDDQLIHVLKGIDRNFGGYVNSSAKSSEGIFKDIFFNKYNDYRRKINEYEYNTLEMIKDNLESTIDSRYLLLIYDNDNNNDINDIDKNLLKFCLLNKKYEILSDKDLNKYDYEKNGILNILLKIQALMKQEIILILKNLEILYPSLYELFNKNFSEYGGGKNFVRISYENSYSYVEVNENFKMIVLVSKDKLDEEQKPFLNRFEKYLFTLPNIFKKKKEMIDNYNN